MWSSCNILLFILIFCATGCVTRSMVINTDPPGAQVFLDDEPIGESPVKLPYAYYGTRKITIEKRDKDGRLTHKRLTVMANLKPPYYQFFPVDVFSELVVPVTIKDKRTFDFQLEPVEFRPRKEITAELLKNAEELRQRALAPEP
ncbi:MAG: PEGA domain-containing protein [Candidatus Brocadiales bacterium]